MDKDIQAAVEAEREECARVAEEVAVKYGHRYKAVGSDLTNDSVLHAYEVADEIANLIRMRSQA